MRSTYIQSGLAPMGTWAQDSWSAANMVLKELAANLGEDQVKLSYWQLIFLQSRVNGCLYEFEDLPHANWQWPKNTWFQERLSQYLHALEPAVERAIDQRRLRPAVTARRKAKDRRLQQ